MLTTGNLEEICDTVISEHIKSTEICMMLSHFKGKPQKSEYVIEYSIGKDGVLYLYGPKSHDAYLHERDTMEIESLKKVCAFINYEYGFDSNIRMQFYDYSDKFFYGDYIIDYQIEKNGPLYLYNERIKNDQT